MKQLHNCSRCCGVLGEFLQGAQKAVLNNCPKPVPHLVLGQGAVAPAPRLATLPSQMARRAPGPGAGGGGGQSFRWYSHRAVA